MRIAVAVLLPAALAAADFQSWHVLDTSADITARTTVVLHSRFRTRGTFDTIYQVRGGPILEHALSPRVTVLGGYYLQPEKSRAGEWRNGHRIFGGVDADREFGRVELESRTLVERFALSDASDFNRYRQRFRVSGTSGLRPYGSVEFLADNLGFRSARLSGGVRWKISESVSVDTGYVFEPRVERVGSHRQALVTTLHFRTAPRYADPDP